MPKPEGRKAKRVNARERHRQEVLAAMPDVRELVKRHGLSLVNSCLSKLREHEKKARAAKRLREEAEALERELAQ